MLKLASNSEAIQRDRLEWGKPRSRKTTLKCLKLGISIAERKVPVDKRSFTEDKAGLVDRWRKRTEKSRW